MKTSNRRLPAIPIRFTIHRKLWGILVFFLIVVVISAIATYAGLVKISRYLDSGEIENLRYAVSLRNNFHDMEQFLNDAAVQKDKEILVWAKQEKADFEGHLSHLVDIDPHNKKEYIAVKKEVDEYYDAARVAAELLMKDDLSSPKLRASAEKVKVILPVVHNHLDEIINSKYSMFERMISLSTREAAKIVVQDTLLLMFLALIGFILVFRTIRSIINPIDSLLEATNRLGEGNLGLRTEVLSDDEIGDLAISFNNMADRLEDEHNRLEENRRELAQLLAEREEMQKKIVKSNEELREANILLQKADTAKSEFLASMSHELRTPLNAMINFTDQVIEDWEDLKKNDEWFAEAKGMLARVLGSSRHLLDLINDLLDLAKIESGKMTLDLANADLADIVEDCVISVDSLAKKKNLQLLAHFEEKENPILCDKRKVKQIVLNLLGNAIKFADSGQVKASIRKDATVYPDGYLLEVEDEGIGIPPEYHQRIFDRFQQVDGSDSRKHAGTGLGLNLVKELTEMHGGKVELRSEPNKGTKFTIYLPLKARIQEST